MMQLEYINENLNIIMQNPDSVLYIKPYNIGSKEALFAVVKEDQGVYRKIQITKEQSKMMFPFEPIYWFYKGPGFDYLKKFLTFNNYISLNKTNLDGFMFMKLSNKIFNVGIFATFNDGSATFVIRERAKKFEKNGGIKSYIDLLEESKKNDSNYGTYEIIDFHSVSGNTFIIPELQGNMKESSPTRKLINNKK